MGKCTGERCPMNVGYDVANCKANVCTYRTEERATDREVYHLFRACMGAYGDGEGHFISKMINEAIKEFAERLKELPECQDVPAVLAVIDDLVKEMVGDSDEN